MVLQNSELDEGIGDTDSLGESWESRKFQATHCRSFKTIVEVVRFCEARLLRKNIEGRDEHYLNVSKALYLEVSELKAFLGHVLHAFEKENKLPINKLPSIESNLRPQRTKKYINGWAKLWIKVMDELRQKTKEQHELNDASAKPFPPETEYYKCTPFDIANIGSTEDLQASLRTRTIPLEKCEDLPSDAENRIFDFLRSRVSSQEELKLNDDDDQSNSDIRPMSPDSLDDCLDGENNTRTAERKVLPVNNGLTRKISDWDRYSLDDTLEQDFLDGSYQSDEESNIQKKKDSIANQTNINKTNDKKHKSIGEEVFDDSMSSLQYRRNTIQPLTHGNNRFSKSELCLHQIDIDQDDEDFNKIGASLTEIFKIRQELTRAEVEFIKDLDVKNGKKCFGCQNNKFTFFQRSRNCSVCKKKYCFKCIKENVSVPASLTETLPANIDILYNNNTTKETNLVRSKSMINVAPSSSSIQRIQMPWQKDSKLNGVRLSMCSECHVFVESIKSEKKKSEWTVHLELDL